MRDIAAAHLESVGKGTVIFEGKVGHQEIIPGSSSLPTGALSMTSEGAHRIVTIRASRVYRGSNQKVFVITTGMGGSDCGFNFDTGQKYLVYAEAKGNTFFTSICTKTEILQRAGTSLRLLRGEPPQPEDLLDPESYYKKMLPLWTGAVCGRINGPDGSPMNGASVSLSPVRADPFHKPCRGCGVLSKDDGSFCLENVAPGEYLLTAEKNDNDQHLRLMAFYPGGAKHSEATPIKVEAKRKLSDLQFSVQNQPVFTIKIRVVPADGSSLPWKEPGEHLRVGVTSSDYDALAYNIDGYLNSDGSRTFGYIPPGHYLVWCRVHPSIEDMRSGKVDPTLSRWQIENQEVDVRGDSEAVLKLSLAP